MKVSISRNKREGYYAGHYRPNDDFAQKTKPKAWRWSWFAMHEFYPPVWGNVMRRMEAERVAFNRVAQQYRGVQ